MAEKVERNPFTPFLNGFNYDQAFDGGIWRLVKGEDYEQAPSTVAAKIRQEFEHRYGELQIRQDGDVLTIRRVPGTRA